MCHSSKGSHAPEVFTAPPKGTFGPQGLYPQQNLNKKKTSLTFNTQGESTASAVKMKIYLQACGLILFSKSMKVNKHSTLGCCFPKNFSSGEKGSDSQALKEEPGTERGFRVSRHQEFSSLLLMCSSPGTWILTSSTSQSWYCQHSCWQRVGYTAGLGIPGLLA